MRYVELFAGAGGLSMGLEAAGMHPVAHAEIEPHARAVLRRQWPDTPLHGDVTQVDWTQYAGQVDLVAGGSPCQDLSVAGKRAGLVGARSGLFFELIRAWDETGAPYCLWENVDGARSSNKGEDFAAVLSAFVGAPVAVPGTGRWTSAGVVAGSTGVAAWRVLDLQHFGPPQRRRRLFVVAARTGGADPAEILALAEGVCGHPSPRDQQRQGAARGAAGGVAFGSTINTITPRVGGSGSGWATWNETEHLLPREYGGGAGGSGGRPIAFTTTQTPITFTERGRGDALSVEARRDGTVNCIRSPNGGRGGIGSTDAVLAFPIDTRNATRTTDKSEQNRQGVGIGDAGDPSPTLTSLFVPAVLALDVNGSDTAQTLRGFGHGWQGQHNSTNAVLAFTPGFVARGEGPRPQQDLVQTLGANTQGDQAPHIVCLASGQANAEVVRDGMPTLNTIHEQPIVARMVAFGEYTEDGMASAIKARDHKDATDLVYAKQGRPRRLTPLECERLMGWKNSHTAQGIREDGTAYALSDTARYRLCGNGVGTPVAAWIATRLVAAVEGLCPP